MKVAINELGRRIGQDHHNAKLTDHEVELIRELHAEKAMGYRKLAQKFEVSKSLVREIIQERRRVHQVAFGWKIIKRPEK
jgi:DNA invertase Pin-like site-specific DNA recombinase